MAHNLIDAIDEVKQKLTDSEYKNIVDLVAELHKKDSKPQQPQIISWQQERIQLAKNYRETIRPIVHQFLTKKHQ